MTALRLYPIKFIPILKEKVWGGNKLNQLFNKHGDSNTIGESWELSGVVGNVSFVANGVYANKNLNELVAEFPIELLGNHVFNAHGPVFPLLFKFIDAKLDLSVQVHPNDNLAKKHHDSFGKTEMWYIMQADPKAQLIVDFNQPISKQEFLKHLEDNSVASVLNYNQVKKGDSYFIAPGVIHAICGGVLLAEIQQTSDITYRVYDWDRPDIDGNHRELHIDLAVKALNFKADKNQQIRYQKTQNTANDLCTSSFFRTNYLPLTTNLERSLAQIDSFVVYMCVAGKCAITLQNNSVDLVTGETVLIPAAATEVVIHTHGAELLEVSVP